jgi:hypothetical protein
MGEAFITRRGGTGGDIRIIKPQDDKYPYNITGINLTQNDYIINVVVYVNYIDVMDDAYCERYVVKKGVVTEEYHHPRGQCTNLAIYPDENRISITSTEGYYYLKPYSSTVIEVTAGALPSTVIEGW